MPTNKYILDLLKYVSKNPSLALREVIAISESDIGYMIKNLQEQGIEIEIIAAKNDPVYTPQKIKENNPDMAGKIHEIDGVASHGEIFMDADKFIKIADELLEKK